MMTMRTDIFGLTPRQHDMFGEPQGTFDTPMTIDDIRAELERTVTELRAASVMPWPVRRMQAIDIMFPDHAARLPESERAALVDAFEAEMRRLGRRAD